jgi:signal transduction histidine kinase
LSFSPIRERWASTVGGTGFVVEAALQDPRPGHMGLATMRERVELAGGRLRIDSGRQGTAVGFWIPDGATIAR